MKEPALKWLLFFLVAVFDMMDTCFDLVLWFLSVCHNKVL